METINNSLAKIEAVLKAVDSFETTASSADFEKKYLALWPDIKGGLEAVALIKKELSKLQLPPK